jgi:hypothetical protein
MLGFLGAYILRRRRGYRTPRPGERRAAGVARVVAYLLAVAVVLGVLSLRSAMADVGEASQALGHELLPLADVLGDRTQLVLNGQNVYVGSASSDEPVATVLDRFERVCHENRAAAAEVWSKVSDIREGFAKATPEQLAKTPHGAELKAALQRLAGMPVDKFGTIRTGNGDSGAIICFTQASGAPADAMAAWTAFKQTGELSNVGNLRYAYAARTKQSTHVMTAWTEGRFNFNTFAGGPKTADAPGYDPVGIPRPPEARRVVTASIAGTPYGMHMYESKSGVAEVLAFYDTKMTDAGWTTLRPIGTDRETMRGYQKGDVQVGITTRRFGGLTQVMLGELGRPAARAAAN